VYSGFYKHRKEEKEVNKFIFNSRDYHIKRALIRAGWELANSKTAFYKLKWTYKDKAEDYNYL
jgi:hypothetical protein